MIAASLAAAFLLRGSQQVQQAVLIAGFAFWVAALFWVLGFQRGTTPRVLDSAAVRFVAGWLVLVPCWLALVRLHDQRRPPTREEFAGGRAEATPDDDRWAKDTT